MIAGLFGVLAIIGLFATTVTVWAKGTLFNSDRVAAAVDDALKKPEVNAAMAAYLTDQLFTMVDVNSHIESVLPPALQKLEPAIVGGAHGVVEGRTGKAAGEAEVRQVIVRLVHTAHASLMKLLQGGGLSHGVTVNDGQVTVNLLPLLSRGLLAVQGLGLFDNANIPTLTPDGDPAEQITELEKASGRGSPRQLRAARRVQERQPGPRRTNAELCTAGLRQRQASGLAHHRLDGRTARGDDRGG